MKKFLTLLVGVMMGTASIFAFEPVNLNVAIIDETPIGPGHGKTPLQVPSLFLDDHQLTFESSHPAYALTLFDEDGFVVYQTAVSATTYTVVLPSTLTGTFVLTLDFGGSYYFWSEIEL